MQETMSPHIEGVHQANRVCPSAKGPKQRNPVHVRHIELIWELLERKYNVVRNL